jgi:hypothetical protein
MVERIANLANAPANVPAPPLAGVCDRIGGVIEQGGGALMPV